MAAGLGINALLRPSNALAMWGFPHPGATPSPRPPKSSNIDTITESSSTSSQFVGEGVSATEILVTPEGRLAEALMQLYGSRTLTVGIALLATSRWGSRESLIAVSGASTFIAFMDGFVARKIVGEGAELAHWGFVSWPFLLCPIHLHVCLLFAGAEECCSQKKH
jgi:hypothetical protein